MKRSSMWVFIGFLCVSAAVLIAYETDLFSEARTAETTPAPGNSVTDARDPATDEDEAAAPPSSDDVVATQYVVPSPIDDSIQSKVSEFYDAATAAEAAEVLDSFSIDEESEPVVMHLRASLGRACSNTQRNNRNPEKGRYFAERLARYCGSYTVDEVELLQAEMWNSEFLLLLSNAIEQNMVGMTMAKQEEYILDWVRNASNALELQALMLVIGGSYYSAKATDRQYESQIHRFGQDPNFRGEQGTDIQRTALRLMQCAEFVNCGPNSHLTLTECFLSQLCEPGWSLHDLIYNSHSPLEDEQIMAVLETFYRVRNG